MQKTVKDSSVIFLLIALLFGALTILVLRARTVAETPHPELYAAAFLRPGSQDFEIGVSNIGQPLELAYEVRNEENEVLASERITLTEAHPTFDALAPLAERGTLHGRITIRITGPGGTPRELSKVLP